MTGRLPSNAVGFDVTPLEVSRRAGVSRYVAQLLDALVARGDERRYALLASRPLRGPLPAGTLGHMGPRLPNRWLWMQLRLPLALRRLRPSVCHFTNSIAPLAAPTPFVLTLHDMSLFLHPETQPRKSRLLIRTLIPAVARRASAIITVSASARRDILAILGVAPERVHVVPEAPAPGFRVVRHRRELDRVRRRYALADDGRLLLSVGTLEPRKNLDRLVRAFAAARRHDRTLSLVVAGQPGWGFAPLGPLVERLGLRAAVRFLGYVPERDLPALYTLARATVFPSLYEGFGLPIVESMACGTPVLTSDRSAMAEVAGDAAFLVDPTDVEAMTEGLSHLTTDASLRARLRAAGLARAASFSWPAVADRTAAVYSRVTRGALDHMGSQAVSDDLEVA